MVTTMYEAPGLGLAGPQVGVQKRIFVYDVGDGPQTVINPEIVESRGEWGYEEGCLSIPGLSFELVRPAEVHLKGYDLDGNEVSIEAADILARCFQHELRSEEHTSELQSLMRISYAVFCLKKKTNT